MRVRTGLAVLLVAVLVAPWSSRQDDAEDCPGHFSEAYLRSEKGQAYLREVEKLTGSTGGVIGSGEAYATYFTVTCEG